MYSNIESLNVNFSPNRVLTLLNWISENWLRQRHKISPEINEYFTYMLGKNISFSAFYVSFIYNKISL